VGAAISMCCSLQLKRTQHTSARIAQAGYDWAGVECTNWLDQMRGPSSRGGSIYGQAQASV
jgi:hypothetical protein